MILSGGSDLIKWVLNSRSKDQRDSFLEEAASINSAAENKLIPPSTTWVGSGSLVSDKTSALADTLISASWDLKQRTKFVVICYTNKSKPNTVSVMRLTAKSRICIQSTLISKRNCHKNHGALHFAIY